MQGGGPTSRRVLPPARRQGCVRPARPPAASRRPWRYGGGGAGDLGYPGAAAAMFPRLPAAPVGGCAATGNGSGAQRASPCFSPYAASANPVSVTRGAMAETINGCSG